MNYLLFTRSRSFSSRLPDLWTTSSIFVSCEKGVAQFVVSQVNRVGNPDLSTSILEIPSGYKTDISKGSSSISNGSSDIYSANKDLPTVNQFENNFTTRASANKSDPVQFKSSSYILNGNNFSWTDKSYYDKLNTSSSSTTSPEISAPNNEILTSENIIVGHVQGSGSDLSDLFLRQVSGFNSPTSTTSQFLVQFERNTPSDQKSAAIAMVGGKIEHTVHAADSKSGDLILISVNSAQSADRIIEALSKNPLIKFAEINAELNIQGDVTDTYYMNNSMWGMYGDKTSPYINQFGSQAGEVWANGKVGKTSVVIGDVDTGIDYTHPDLYQNIWLNQNEISSTLKANLKDTDGDGLITFRDLNNSLNTAFVSDLNGNGRIEAGDLLKDSRWADGIDQDGNGYKDDLIGWDFVNNDNDPYDDNKHGTHTSGTIGGTNDGSGVIGVCPNVQMMALKFLSSTGSGATSDAIKAIDYFTNTSANNKTSAQFVALNNSWGGGTFTQSLQDSITRAALKNILFVAAAGNGGSDGIGDNNDSIGNFPSNCSTLNTAGYEAVIAVAALTSSGSLASYSNFGASTVDLGAPGTSILSTTPGGGYAYLSGTSMATPHVTGALALLASYFPTYSAAQLRDLLLKNVVSTPSLAGLTSTGGRLDVSNLFGSITTPQISTISVGADTSTVKEGDSGSTTVTFKIQLSAALTSDQSINWSLSGSSYNAADMATDLSGASSGSVTFSSSSGETLKTVTVSILGDTQIESDETFTFSLSLPSTTTSLVMGASSATVTILNDDDDIPYSNATLGTVSVNSGAINSAINFVGDGDAYKISLVGGIAYRFDLAAASSSSLNPYLELYDQNFSLLASNNSGVISSTSQLYFTPIQSGIYYIGAKGSSSSIGGYLLSAVDQNSVTGTAGNDTISGTALKDTILGLGGNDTLSGSDGDDILNGGAGDDSLNGGLGNDTASYEGTTSALTVSLAITTGQNTGGSGKDTLTSFENLIGGQANDTLTGNASDNRIDGGAGNDVINGGAGKDTLIGGQGADSFVFNTALGTSNIENVLDFAVSEDIIRLENAIMTKIGKAGALSAAFFKILGTGPQQDSNDYVLYDNQTGALSYDGDASGSGSPVQFAKLSAGLALTANNFLVI